MPPEVDGHEEQKHNCKRKGRVLELLVDGRLTMEECLKTVKERQVNGRYASCMQIVLASLSCNWALLRKRELRL